MTAIDNPGTRRQEAPLPVTGVGVGISDVEPAPDPRGGYVAAWGGLGVLAVALAASIWVRWIMSDTEFRPAPVLGPDEVPTWNLVVLRIGRLGLDAKIVVGCLIGSVTDGVLNMHEYLFAWNARSIDMGSWASFVPTASPDHQSRYAEALIWGIPMYTYFCIGVAIVGTKLIVRLRCRHPAISNVRCFGLVFVLACIFDFVIENLVIRLGHGYAFARTPEVLTLNAGSQFQFPLYEVVSVGLLGVLFTGLRLSAIDSPDGLSYVERGFWRLPGALQQPARWFAIIGWCVLTLFVLYHLPFQFFGLTGDSMADLPSYMLPGD